MNSTLLRLMAMALRSIMRFPFKFLLPVSCIAAGVASVTASVNYAESGRQRVLEQLRALGTNVVAVTSRQNVDRLGRKQSATALEKLTDVDYREIKRQVPGVVRTSALVSRSLPVKANGAAKDNCTILGCEPEYFAIKAWDLQAGEGFGADDLRRSARTALLGYRVAQDLFGEVTPIGQRLFINRVPFVVAGVLSERGQSLDVASEDAQIYVPLTTAMRRLGNSDQYGSILLQIEEPRIEEDLPVIARVLRVRHHAPGNGSEDFQVQSVSALLAAQQATSRRLEFVVRLVGSGCFLILGAGSLGLAWMAVAQRFPEIGTRRALGATRQDVFVQVALEFGTAGSLGSVTGALLGGAALYFFARKNNLPIAFDWTGMVEVLSAAFALNVVFALIPSRRAAWLQPAKAMGMS